MINDNVEELFELAIEDAIDGMIAVSLVESPAIERDFVFMSKEIQFAEVSEEKQLVAGPLLIPNKKILRLKEDGSKYYVYFTEDGIEQIARKFMKQKLGDSVTLEHGNKTSGVYLTELWLIESSTKDKSNLYNFTLPKGTLFGIYKIEDKRIWEKVKDGTFRGFSIEAILEHRKSNVKLNLERHIEELDESEVEILLGEIKSLISKQNRVEMEVGVPHYTKDGKLWEGPTHKDAEGRLMTGEVHSEDSEYLYHREDLEAQPSITSSYPGQIASGSVAPALLK